MSWSAAPNRWDAALVARAASGDGDDAQAMRYAIGVLLYVAGDAEAPQHDAVVAKHAARLLERAASHAASAPPSDYVRTHLERVAAMVAARPARPTWQRAQYDASMERDGTLATAPGGNLDDVGSD